MNKKTQDLAWACLPKETREEIKKRYKTLSTSFLTERYMELNNLFGHHNLTSDTEPSELLYVERKKVQEMYKQGIQKTTELHIPKDYCATCRVLDLLFGDKCLPDTPNTPNSGELKSDKATCKENLQDEQPSVQVEPRFHKGQSVIYEGRLYEVEGKTGKHHYALKGSCYDAHEDNLEPYTEPSNVSLNETKEETKEETKDKSNDNQLKDNTQQNSWDKLNAEFKRFDECCNKIIKTLESLCDTFNKMEDCINKL